MASVVLETLHFRHCVERGGEAVGASSRKRKASGID